MKKNSLILLLCCITAFSIFNMKAEELTDKEISNIDKFSGETPNQHFADIRKYVLKQLDEKLKSYPDKLWPLIMQGWTYNSMGDFKRAVISFESSIEIIPTPTAYMGLGMALNKLGKTELANKCFITALKMEPETVTDENITPPEYGGTDAYGSGYNGSVSADFIGQKSIYELMSRISGAPELEAGYKQLLTHKSDDAAVTFKKYLEKHPDSVLAYNGLGYSYFYAGDINDAEINFSKALNMDSKSTGAMVGMGRVELEREQYDKALYYFDMALKKNPDLVSAYYGKIEAFRLRELNL